MDVISKLQVLLINLGLGVISAKTLRSLQADQFSFHNLKHFVALSERVGMQIDLETFRKSRAQLHQEILAQAIFQISDRNLSYQPTFVEIGAADGIENSNSLYLEEGLGWSGLLVEPNPLYRSRLMKNRPKSKVDFRAAADCNGVADFVLAEQFSSFATHAGSDLHSAKRRGPKVQVETVPTEKLFQDNDVPSFVDFLSIDTEGSELQILKSIDFETRKFGMIAVEHNFVEQRRAEIHEHLVSKGYARVLESLSQFDDWYLHAGNLEAFQGLARKPPPTSRLDA